ncbi:polyprenyl synthetase family protein [Propionibacteriaceae bacterium Y1923]
MNALAHDQWDWHRDEVEQQLTEFFEAGGERVGAYGPAFERLWSLAAQTVTGGKLVRPLLLIDAWHALAPARPRRELQVVLDLAVALELLHYAFLLHDDVIDGDVLRRGRPNLIGALRGEASAAEEAAAHWAHSGGILMGDLLLSSAHQVFARADLPRDQHLQLLDLLDHTITESVAGELVDVGLADGVIAPELSTILAMTSHKTATYTFELPLRMAAVLAGSRPGIEGRLGAIGRHLGLAFQLQDDLLSTFGDPRCHGKDRWSDLREGKQTAIIAHARHTETWPRIEPLLGRPGLCEQEAEHLSELLVDCGAKGFVEALVEDQWRHAHALVTGGEHELPPAMRRSLLALLDQLRGRQS